MELTVEVELDEVLDHYSTQQVLDEYSTDEILEYLNQKGVDLRQGLTDKDIILELVKSRTDRYPDKETIKEVLLDMVDFIW